MRFKNIIIALVRHGLIVINVVGDDPFENRRAMKLLVLLSIEYVLECHLTDNLRRLLPTDIKKSFPHPLRSDILLFIGSDMPYLIQKFVKDLERSGNKIL